MNDKTVVQYETDIDSLIFKHGDGVWPFGITEIQGASSVEIGLSVMTAIGQEGNTVVGRQVKPRLLTVNGYLLGDVEYARKRLLACVAPGRKARLIVKNAGEDTVYVDGEPIATPEIVDGVGLQEFQFQLQCAYPYWKSEGVSVHSFRNLKNLFSFPHYTGGTWFISRYDEGKEINARNEGHISVGVTLRLQAIKPTSGPIRICNLTTGEKIEVLYPMLQGDIFEICTQSGQRYAKSIESGEEKNGYYRVGFNSDLRFSLAAGDNILKLEYAEQIGSYELTIKAPEGVLAGV